FGEGDESRRAPFVALALAGAAALWTHYLAVFLILACLPLITARRRWLSLGALGTAGAPFSPWTPILAAQPAQAVAWVPEPVKDSLFSILSALGGAGRVPSPLGGPLGSALVLLGAAVGLALLVSVTLAARQDRLAADAVLITLLTMGLVLVASLRRPVA